MFPVPRHVFGGPLTRWRTVVDPEAWPGLEGVLEDVVVASCAGESRTVRGKGGVVFRGGVGQVRYDFSSLSPEAAHACGVSARGPFFAGVGYKTPQGMGQVIPEP